MVFELQVVEGRDVGHLFTLNGDEVLLGRGDPDDADRSAVLLTDPTVSKWQARFLTTDDTLTIEHLAAATNPTVVNGLTIDRQRLVPGDRIRVGRVVLEVSARDGYALSGGSRIPDDSTRTLVARADATRPVDRDEVVDGDRETPLHLVAVRGAAGAFRVLPGRTLIGRAAGCDVAVDDMSISREHAELVWEGAELWLVHRSQVNDTRVNGARVSDRRKVSSGDLIELADRTAFRLVDEPTPYDSDPKTRPVPAPATAGDGKRARRPSLGTLLEQNLLASGDLEGYRVTGSFLDADVVGSYDMKAASGQSRQIIISFKRWRSFMKSIIEEFGGEVLSSNGDELMCFFETTAAAVEAGRAMLRRLASFNAERNLLSAPFRLRVGVHTGSALIDRGAGLAFSPVLDIAGHLQKAAPVDGLVISQEGYEDLADRSGFVAAGELERQGIPTFCWLAD